jgi:predicted phosphodiesterase
MNSWLDAPPNRRQFLVRGGQAAAGCLLINSSKSTAQSASINNEFAEDTIRFFAIGDTHYFANEKSNKELMESSVINCHGLIDTLNKLPGTLLPETIGGGAVGSVQGVIHAGDIIDTGDKRGRTQESMQAREWEGFTSDFGLTGTEGRLKFPVYEVYGNHDSPGGDGLAIEGLIERSKKRNVLSRSANGLHYSWDWGPVHCINLGIVVGQDRRIDQRRRYNPMDSLDFLIGDLQQYASDPDRPILITHHVDVVRYSKSCDGTDAANLGLEWNPCDVRAYYETIRKHNVLAILYGHTHVRNILQWNGTQQSAQLGIPLLNIDNSSHFSGGKQAFFYIEIDSDELRVRECATKDSWATYEWTPSVWRFPAKQTSI